MERVPRYGMPEALVSQHPRGSVSSTRVPVSAANHVADWIYWELVKTSLQSGAT
jgi:hypothetical protein